jgi:hypothetical protein
MKKLIISLMLLAFCPGFLLTGQAQTSKDQYAFDVFEDIIRAVNRSFPSPPKLVIVNNPNMVAVTSSDGTIQVSSTLIELMRGCGADSANALAHVLAHEVMHYYNEHFWAGNFALPYADAGWGEELQMIDSDTLQLQYQETQADLYGLFYATNAGYVTAPIADAVIDSIYRWFDLPFKMKHYPDLDARKGMARSAAEQVYAMIPSYEAGIYLLHLAAGATGNEQFTFLRGASSFFYHITDNYIRTREMLNNIAVVKIMEALTYFDEHLALLQWPLLIETGSVLYEAAGSRGKCDNCQDYGSAELPEEALYRLEEAKQLLEEALQLEKGYYPAQVNLSIVYAILGKKGSMTDLLDEMDPDLRPGWLEYELYGLAAMMDWEEEEAARHFKKAMSEGSPSAEANQAISKGNLSSVTIDIPPIAEIKTLVDSLPIAEFFNALVVDRNNRTDVKNGDCLLFVDTIGDFQVMEIKFRFSDKAFRTLKFVRLLPGVDAATAEGLELGDNMKKLLKLYGEQYKTSNDNDHHILVFPHHYFMAWLNTQENVDSWAYWWAM